MTKILIDEAVVRQALEALESFADGVYYEDEEDSIGRRFCCDVLSYKPHQENCAAAASATALRQALAEAEQPAPAQPLTWVSVKDRLPPVDEDVLTYDVTYPDDGFDIERRLSEREWSVKYSVTHWMPLPDAPKAAHGIAKGGAT